MALVSLKSFTRLAHEITETLPPELFRQFNGRVIVEPSIKEEGDFLVMGEYIEEPGTGNLILLYYGSFQEMLGNAAIEEWRQEIEETIVHELRHHIESLAGIDDLSFEEKIELERESST